jgi:hypothetical protein
MLTTGKGKEATERMARETRLDSAATLQYSIVRPIEQRRFNDCGIPVVEHYC